MWESFADEMAKIARSKNVRRQLSRLADLAMDAPRAKAPRSRLARRYGWHRSIAREEGQQFGRGLREHKRWGERDFPRGLVEHHLEEGQEAARRAKQLLRR